MTLQTLEEEKLQADAQSRIRALAHRSFIVEAPAGAGKTELLTQRFLSLLAVVDAPEEIIAITFTNKAAAEMRARILDSLFAAAHGEMPAQAHKQTTFELSQAVLKKSDLHTWQLLENPARLRIFTIDSLCAYLSRQMPLMSRFGAQPTISDEPSQYYAQAVEATLDLINQNNPVADENVSLIVEVLRYFDHDVSQVKKLLVRMLSLRDQWLNHTQQVLTAEALNETLHFVVQSALAEVAEIFDARWQSTLMPLAHFAAKNLAAAQDAEDKSVVEKNSICLLAEWQQSLTSAPEDLPYWQTLADLLLTKDGFIRKRVDKNIGFPSDNQPEYKDKKSALMDFLNDLASVPALEKALASVRQLPQCDADDETSWKIIHLLSRLLNLTAAQLWLTFRQAREVDFAEVAERATHALAGSDDAPTDLAMRLDYQIQHILVDEFQDTSPSQVHLLEKLTQCWQPGDGRTLFAVGDPMQSIYRFRKANVGLFLNAATVGIGDIQLEKLSLYRNNRSCPPVIDWINQTFTHIFPPTDETTKGAIAYRPFIATRADTTNTGVEIHPVIQASDESTEMVKQREAQAVVNVILQERLQYPDRKIAILVRAKSHLQPIVSLLRRHHAAIKFQEVEIEALSHRQIIQDLLALTCALHHRADRVSWLAVLRAPWCGLTLNDLHALAGNHHTSTIWALMHQENLRLSADGLVRLTHVREIFSEAFANQGRVNNSRWVRGVWLMLGGAACLWEAQDVVDVQAFFDCIEALDRNHQFSLERLAADIEKLFAAPDAAGAHLQMMTIHKSKGLEFDTVILPGLGADTNGHDEKPIVLWEEVPTQNGMQLLAAPLLPKSLRKQASASVYDYLSLLEKEREENENVRILYVAATRAEKKLHLVGIATQSKEAIKPTKNTFLALLWPAVKSDYEAKSAEENIAKKSSELPENTLENFVPTLIRLAKPYIPEVLQHVALSDKKRTFSAGNAANPLMNTIEADIGTLTHRYLELIVKQNVEHWPLDKISRLSQAMQHWFVQQGHAEKIAIKAAQDVQSLLTTTLTSPDGLWLLKKRETDSAELAISSNSIALDNTQEAKNYVVDRTFVEIINGEKLRWIIDYKTVDVKPAVDASELAEIAQQYYAQLENYASLMHGEGVAIQLAIYFVRIGKLFLFKKSL